MNELYLDNRIPIRIIRSSRRTKSISLRVLPHEVQIRVPLRTTKREVDQIVSDRTSWILEKWNEVQLRSDSQVWPPAALYLRGERIRLDRQIRSSRQGIVTIQQVATGLKMSVPAAAPQEMERKALEGWFKRLAKQELSVRVPAWADKLGYQYQELRIKDQKSRWGSCSQSGNLNFNWRLIMAPTFVMEYVIVHELCHLREMNHSSRFWQLVERAFPAYNDARLWLKQNATLLYF